MAITIQQIKELREATAAGMGACKEALTATNGNMEEAVKYLREKGLAVAAKRVDKESKQGIVALAVAADKKSMALAEVNCETDFVAKTEAFIKFVDDAAKVAPIEESLIEAWVRTRFVKICEFITSSCMKNTTMRLSPFPSHIT